ncbi:hypothetical protein IEQ34_026045 [Dendrobium chrysotoxum]|uniref:Uncharacterized protein n=1 Tax=Dendrobium chrysotoxum TaxID=161865 RepID=A0AAV7FIS5_DENCH|nr:hypothetical protein IEQ34_026045 [Dendrobium chrysotoxum]
MSPKNEFISEARSVSFKDQARSEEDLVYFIQKNGKSGKEASASQFGKHREKRCVAKKEGATLKEQERDQIRRFNAGGDFFEMHLTDREDYVEWYASVSTGPILPPHMRIGSNYASRGGQAASRIAELRRYLDTLIRERDTSFSIFFLYGSSIDLI